jgi:hypothetical protein
MSIDTRFNLFFSLVTTDAVIIVVIVTHIDCRNLSWLLNGEISRITLWTTLLLLVLLLIKFNYSFTSNTSFPIFDYFINIFETFWLLTWHRSFNDHTIILSYLIFIKVNLNLSLIEFNIWLFTLIFLFHNRYSCFSRLLNCLELQFLYWFRELATV